MSRFLRSSIVLATAGTIAIAYLSWSIFRVPPVPDAKRQTADGRTGPETARLKSELAVLERQLQIERASYGDVAKQLKALSDENARLRDEIALLQAVAGADAKPEGIRLTSVRVEPVGEAGEYAYRMVVVQTGSRMRPFQGSYQLMVNLIQNGARQGILVPAKVSGADELYQLAFTAHQRIEGTFKVAPNAVVRSVQVRIFEDGAAQPKLMQTVTLS